MNTSFGIFSHPTFRQSTSGAGDFGYMSIQRDVTVSNIQRLSGLSTFWL
ncbi:hypothetical protein SJ05684_b55360 (plasmid) [Sinorhizobium sojae CCBAU 05684]|uniref:Uncharacterized protein n=1 Tax=Sinorhizobium sojae CCBAU 05684 TaxID=716928 RepID=A0A249PKR5_9HYPH|nr:hypothetical protein SJ05684_b55360 [Sinorhizobium sojae CCBAU 05684]